MKHSFMKRITVTCHSTVTGGPCYNTVETSFSARNRAVCAECKRLQHIKSSEECHRRAMQRITTTATATIRGKPGRDTGTVITPQICRDCGRRLVACRCLDRLDEDAYVLAARNLKNRKQN